MSNVFLSYSRRDKEFVVRLQDALTNAGKSVWVDTKDIPATAQWRDELASGIDSAEAFVFVLSPDSLRSEVCEFELSRAVDQGKRIVPLVYREPNGQSVPEALSSRNWIFCRPEQDGFEDSLRVLVEALDTDLDWVRAHTRLLVRATEWDRNGRDRSYLLTGRDLAQAESWLTEEGAERIPQPVVVQREYVAAGRQAATRRQKRLLGGVSAALIVSIGLAIFAFIELGVARDQRATAQSRSLSQSALANLGTDPELSALLAVQAIDRKNTPEAELALRQALGDVQVRGVLHHRGAVNQAVYSPDGRWVATVSDDGTAAIWSSRTHRRVHLLRGHLGDVRQEAFSPDSHRLLTAGHDGTARIWDVGSGRALGALHGPPGATLAAFVPHATLIATANVDRSLRVWSDAGSLLHVVRPHAGVIYALAVSPSGRLVATAQEDGTARLWSLPGTRPAGVLHGSDKALSQVAFSPDGRRLATGGDDGTTRLWTPSGHQTAALHAPGLGVSGLAFSPSGDEIVTANLGLSNAARLWNAFTGRSVAILRGHSAPINDVAFSGDGRLIVSASNDGTARVWRASDGQTLTVLAGHHGPVFQASFSPDSRSVATASADDAARVWDADPGHSLTVVRQPELIASDASPDGRLLLTAGLGSSASLWSAAGGGRVATIAVKQVPGGTLNASVFSPDSKLAAVASAAQTVVVDTATAGRRLRVTIPAGTSGLGFAFFFSPDSRELLIGQPDGRTSAWEARRGRRVALLNTGTAPVVSARFSADGRRVAVTNDGRTASVWNLPAGRRLLTLRGHTDAVTDAVFSPNGQQLLTASDDNTARLWDLATGRKLFVLSHAERVSGVAFSHDGSRALTASADGTAIVWNARTGQPEHVLRGHTAGLFEAHFSPDDRTIVTGSNDGTARLWDAATGLQIALLAGHIGPVGAQFNRAGTEIVSGGLDNTLRTYACDVCGSVPQLLTTVRRIVPTHLTPAETNRYLNGF
ncbi:MAG: toll/interleukin-1 receptor domain-containing protein [Solirubrobacteraceae bacterium]